MKEQWFRLDEKIRFFILASLNMGIRYFIFVMIGLLTGMTHYQFVLLCSWSLSVFIAFYSYKYLVFSSKGHHFFEFMKSIVIWITSYFLNVFLLMFLVEQIKWNVYIAQGTIICFIFLINYFLFKHFAFSQKS